MKRRGLHITWWFLLLLSLQDVVVGDYTAVTLHKTPPTTEYEAKCLEPFAINSGPLRRCTSNSGEYPARYATCFCKDCLNLKFNLMCHKTSQWFAEEPRKCDASYSKYRCGTCSENAYVPDHVIQHDNTPGYLLEKRILLCRNNCKNVTFVCNDPNTWRLEKNDDNSCPVDIDRFKYRVEDKNMLVSYNASKYYFSCLPGFQLRGPGEVECPRPDWLAINKCNDDGKPTGVLPNCSKSLPECDVIATTTTTSTTLTEYKARSGNSNEQTGHTNRMLGTTESAGGVAGTPAGPSEMADVAEGLCDGATEEICYLLLGVGVVFIIDVLLVAYVAYKEIQRRKLIQENKDNLVKPRVASRMNRNDDDDNDGCMTENDLYSASNNVK